MLKCHVGFGRAASAGEQEHSTSRFAAMSQSREIGSLTAGEFQSMLSEDSILVQPLGALEQHGPHLPLATDTIIAEAIAFGAVQRAVTRGIDAWLLPSMSLSKSNEHSWSPGTISMSAQTMQSIIMDIGRSVSNTRCRKILFLNGHGGNSSLLAMMNRELRLEFDLMTFLAHPMLPADQGGVPAAVEHGMGVHGGHDETSLMLHLRPDLVHMEFARRSIPEVLLSMKHVRFGGTVQFGWLSNDFDQSGVIGDPTGADESHGARAFEAAVESMCAALVEISTYRIRPRGSS